MPDLTQLHDELLFTCAYPRSPRELRRAESLLRTFHKRFKEEVFLDPDVTGIAGTANETTFSYDLARWLVKHFPRQVEIDWNEPPDSDRLAAALMHALPMLAEEASVDANVPVHDYLPNDSLRWLLDHVDPKLYDSLSLWLYWSLGNSWVTRTRMRRRPRTIFYQTGPMLTRRDIDLARELRGPRLPIRRLSRREGEKALDMAIGAVAVRHREVYSFTWGDPSNVLAADCGRGVEVLLFTVRTDKRLPLRAGFAPLIFRNGVPIGYADAYGICDRMEVSFNIFYAFRDAEAAFVFARLLKIYRQLFGSTSFSLDPYQIGEGNDEAIEAGAFWFYRKLGFHCTDPGLERLARREEERIAKNAKYRSTPATLRRLARGSMIYDMERPGVWDRFHIRNLARAVQRNPKALPPIKRRSEREYLRAGARDTRFRKAVLRLGRAPELH